jgi:hypothetical protein
VVEELAQQASRNPATRERLGRAVVEQRAQPPVVEELAQQASRNLATEGWN